jgi:hypothetical protein
MIEMKRELVTNSYYSQKISICIRVNRLLYQRFKLGCMQRGVTLTDEISQCMKKRIEKWQGKEDVSGE